MKTYKMLKTRRQFGAPLLPSRSLSPAATRLRLILDECDDVLDVTDTRVFSGTDVNTILFPPCHVVPANDAPGNRKEGADAAHRVTASLA